MKRVIEIDEKVFHELLEAKDRDCPLSEEGEIIVNSTMLADEDEILLSLHYLKKRIVEQDIRITKLQRVI